MELEEAVGKILRKTRKARGLSQERFAEDAGIARTYVSLIERGSSSATLRMLSRVCKGHGLRPSAVLAEAEQIIQGSQKTRPDECLT